MSTRKTTTIKKPTIKTAESVASAAEEKVEAVKVVTDTEAKEPRVYQSNDLIPVRSITHGELLMQGKKSDILYRWYSYGDVTEVEYQDLYTLKNSKSSYIYKPFFVIEDEELLENPRWKDVAELYNSLYDYSDLDDFFKLPLPDFKATLAQAPLGLKDAIKMEAADRIDKGTLDSIQKIKAIDEACGTDLICTIQ